MTTWGPQRKYDGPAREKERELVNANDMNENFCAFADSMEKLAHHLVAQKNIHHLVQHDSVSIDIFLQQFP